MLILLLFIALSRTYGASLPIIPNVVEVREVLQSGPPALQDHKPRTRFDIIWSCVSTLFICTWVAIHPNVPPREGHIRSLWRRIKLMLWTLVVPELILIWAYRQWAAARYIAELFEDESWTAVHGHFLIMGGFSLVKGGVETVLDYESFFELLKIETAYTIYAKERPSRNYQPRFQESFEIAFPTITAAELHDKARGDFLSKAIVILQSLWFIIQCIARGKQGLALTELELVTLALASLNGVMYYFWWDKPLGVKEPIKVYPGDVDPPKKVIHGEGRLERIRASSKLSIFQKFIVCPLHRFRSSVYGLPRHMHTALTWYRVQLSSIHHQLSSISLSTINQFLHDQRQRLGFPGSTHLWFFYLPIMWFFVDPLFALGESLFGIATTTTLKSDATHVPTFYAPNTDDSDDHQFLVAFGLPVVAAVFGALHCIAWNFHFPSHIEQLLWRIGSLTITLIPSVPLVFYALALFVLLVVVSIALLLDFLDGRYGFHISIPSISLPQSVKNVLGAVAMTLLVIIVFLGGAGLVAYMLARLLLLTQAIMLLRKQPESAFYAINWTNFLPHI